MVYRGTDLKGFRKEACRDRIPGVGAGRYRQRIWVWHDLGGSGQLQAILVREDGDFRRARWPLDFRDPAGADPFRLSERPNTGPLGSASDAASGVAASGFGFIRLEPQSCRLDDLA